MGLRKPTTTAALLRRLAIPALFVGIVAYTQLKCDDPEPEAPAPAAAPEKPAAPAEKPAKPATVTTELTGPTMGTTFTVKVRAPELDAAAQKALSAAIKGALDEVNESMSTWLKTSELSRFNDGPADVAVKFSAPTMEVLAISQQVFNASGGAFDVTVGPLVNRWGFGPDDRKGPPSHEEIAALLAAVGQTKLKIDTVNGTVAKPNAGLRVDLSAVAKGYAVDRVALAVEKLGYPSYMVEVGGEVRTGTVGDGAPWRIAIERPSLPKGGKDAPREVYEVLELTGVSMATSGDYRNFIVDGDKLRSHTIDPRTGSPVTHPLASVTVVHPECGAADAWATALMVLGPDEGLKLAQREGLAAMFITRGEAGALTRNATTPFAKYAAKPAKEKP